MTNVLPKFCKENEHFVHNFYKHSELHRCHKLSYTAVSDNADEEAMSVGCWVNMAAIFSDHSVF